VRAHISILVDPQVMEAAGIVPETDVQDAPQAGGENALPSGSETGSERLSIFEDFIDQLDMDKLDDENKGKSDKPDKPDKPGKPDKPDKPKQA